MPSEEGGTGLAGRQQQRSTALGIQDLLRMKRQRFSFLMADCIEEVVLRERVVGYKHVAITEEWAWGVDPDQLVFPDALMLETMTQLGALAFLGPGESGILKYGYLCGFDQVQFFRRAVPGDTIRVEGKFVAAVGRMRRVRCEATLDGELAATAVISYAV